jgi:hypothetical protein
VTIRRIGLLGTVSRAAVGLALLALGALEIHDNQIPGALGRYEIVIGLVVFPVIMVVIVSVAKRWADGPIRFTGPDGVAINCGIIVALFAIPYTREAAALFYGASLLVAAWRGLPGCEATVISNVILGRDDQIGCPIFSPIDAAERHPGPEG